MLLTKWFHEPLWKSVVKVIHGPWSNVIQIQTFLNFFSLETDRLLKPDFMWRLHAMEEWKWIQMIYVRWPSWPPCSYMVKTLKNPKGRWPWNLVCGIGYMSTAKYIQMMTLWWPLSTCISYMPYLTLWDKISQNLAIWKPILIRLSNLKEISNHLTTHFMKK